MAKTVKEAMKGKSLPLVSTVGRALKDVMKRKNVKSIKLKVKMK